MFKMLRNNRPFWFLLKIALTAGSLFWCLYLIDYNKILHLLNNADPTILIWMLPLVILHTANGALRFKVLIDPHHRLSFKQHIRQYFIANYFNLILPSSIGGDAVRIFMLGKKNIAKSKAAAYIFSERLMGLYCLILIAISAGFVIAVSDNITTLALTLTGLSVLSLIVIYLLMHFTRSVKHKHIVNARNAIKELWSHKSRLFAAISLSLLYQILTISFTVLIAIAFKLEVPVMLMLALVPLVWLATVVPISIGGVGVREISFIGLFSHAGVSSEQAVLLSLGTYAAIILAGFIGGIWALHDSFRYSPKQAASSSV